MIMRCPIITPTKLTPLASNAVASIPSWTHARAIPVVCSKGYMETGGESEEVEIKITGIRTSFFKMHCTLTATSPG